ncbi:hypothetical protein [Paenibacillus sp. SYP-B4298]|uniref:hypothetical protein n=1 Tax=Paenibacillus sp. SYP-B4298 TaxID=2996034 RepID=UPI0022DE47AB|nr:hypothetical protein [Paenibacillus sp. SYP-B4298]
MSTRSPRHYYVINKWLALLCIVTLLFPPIAVSEHVYAKEQEEAPGQLQGQLKLSSDADITQYRVVVKSQDESMSYNDYWQWSNVEEPRTFHFAELKAGQYEISLYHNALRINVYDAHVEAGESTLIIFAPQGGDGVIQGQIQFDEDTLDHPFWMYMRSGELELTLDTEYTYNRYAIIGLNAGSYYLAARYQGVQQQRNYQQLLTSGILDVNYKFLSRPEAGGINLSGSLTTTIPGHRVESLYLVGQGGYTWLVQPDPSGQYSVNGLSAGIYRAVVYSYSPQLDYSVDHLTIEQEDTKFSYQFRGESEPGTGTVTGRISDLAGNVPEDVSLQYSLRLMNDDFTHRTDGWSISGMADGDGIYYLAGIDPGVYELDARTGNGSMYGTTAIVVAADETTERDLRIGSSGEAKTISGRVLDVDGSVAVGARITLYSYIRDEIGEVIHETRSSSYGYMLSPVFPGEYLVRAETEHSVYTKRVVLEPGGESIQLDLMNAPPTLSFTVEGKYRVGDVLSVVTSNYEDEDGDEADTPEFKWLTAETTQSTFYEVEGETDATYTIRPEDAGRAVVVYVTPKAKTGTLRGETRSSSPQRVADESQITIASKKVTESVPFDLDIASAIDYNGLPVTGKHTVKLWHGDKLLPEQTVELNSQGEGTLEAISVEDADTNLFAVQIVNATTKKPFELEVIRNTPPQGEVRIVSEQHAAPGVVLQAAFNYADPDGDPEGEHEYQWFRAEAGGLSFEPVAGATTARYEVVESDLGARFRVSVTPHAASGAPVGETVTSDPVMIGDYSSLKTVETEGEAVAGNPVSLWLSGVRSYGGQLLQGEHTVRLRLNPDLPAASYLATFDAGETIIGPIVFEQAGRQELELRVEGLTSYHPFAVEIAPAPQPYGLLSIEGEGTPGSELKANFEWVGKEQVQPVYQWQIGTGAGSEESLEFADIDGAASDSYVIQPKDAGHSIRVKARPLTSGGQPAGEDVYSDAIAVTDQSSLELIVQGKLTAGRPFQLLLEQAKGYNGTALAGKHTVLVYNGQTELGSFEVTFAEGAGWLSGLTIKQAGEYSLTIEVMGAVTPRSVTVHVTEAAAPVGSVAIAGDAHPGSLINAVVSYSANNEAPEGEHSYQWYRSADHDLYTRIDGATDRSYLVSSADEGYYLRVEAVLRTAEGTEGGPVTSEAVWVERVAVEPVVSGLTVIDTDARAGYLSGVIRWNGLADEEGITGYAVYFTDSRGVRIGDAIGETAKGSYHVAIHKLEVPATAAAIAVYAVRGSELANSGAQLDDFDQTSAQAVRNELRRYLFPQTNEVTISHIMKAIATKTDVTGDEVFDKEDARLILSLIDM